MFLFQDLTFLCLAITKFIGGLRLNDNSGQWNLIEQINVLKMMAAFSLAEFNGVTVLLGIFFTGICFF